ncbi:putative membrane-bound ClpP-class protease [Desulfurella amilsii]|uniref:Putative membrane-bound ClpP-class protease n=1 Tax=Desulfurella amilsii TaxID=1562698 RepID=A0A1X4XXL6_9BACT|nr:NfeD family protein [Desulfurella amilsii]OSS42277.1 putative membrane-bound ClpP-class protease [Desulfurella amilsii]
MSADIGEILVFLSFTFLILEIFFASGGIFTFVGLTSFIIGTYFLYLSFNGLPSLFLYVVCPIFIGVFVFVVFVVILGLKAQKAPVKTTENLVGETGVCKKPITKNNPGQIEIEGEIWTASSDEDIEVGQKVKVVKQKSLQLFVKKEE